MWWEEFFWVVYGVGSTLFVLFLFRLGNAVASNRHESIEQQSARPRSSDRIRAAQDVTGRPSDHTDRTTVQHVARTGEANAVEAVASVEAMHEIVAANNGFLCTDSGAHRQAVQVHRLP